MYQDIFQELGFSKNSAAVYETLVLHGELSVGTIATKSGVHRRNVYDVLHKLVEEGFVFEVLESKQSFYQAVNPVKLRELIEEKRNKLESVLPELEKRFRADPPKQAVYVYRGIEGWKNYLRDIIRSKEDFYCIGGKGAWMDERLSGFFPQFIKNLKKNKIKFYHFFDYEVQESSHDILKYVGKNYKFLPAEYSTNCSIDICGDRVNIISDLHLGGVEKDLCFTVIQNRDIADAHRSWFRYLWSLAQRK